MRPRRLVSLLIAGCMMVSLVPASAVTAFAETASDTSVLEDAEATPYEKLMAEIQAAKAGDTVKLSEDISSEKAIVIPENANITLDLNGCTITATGTAVYNDDHGTLTVTDSKGTGEIISTKNAGIAVGSNSDTTIDSVKITGQEGAIITSYAVGATITINGGTFTALDNAVVAGNGSKDYKDEDENKIQRSGSNEIIINGGTFEGHIKSTGYIACGIYAPWDDNITVNDGTFNIENGAGIVARAGHVKVTGGTFNTSGNATGWVGDNKNVLPCSALVFDSKAGYPAMTDDSKIEVTGGEFESKGVESAITTIDNDTKRIEVSRGTFSSDPSDFCVKGKVAKENGGSYTVQDRTYNVDTKVDVDEDPEDKNPETPNEGTVGEPVEIAVTVTGEDVPEIETVTLDFGDAAEKVSDVSITNGKKTVSLTEKYKGNYEDLSVAELNALFDENTSEPAAEENGIATLAADPADASAKTELNFTFLVTYTDNNTYNVDIVFKDAAGDEGVVVSKKTATVQIGPKADDAGKDDNTGDNTDSGDGAGAVIAGVVLGTGAVVLAYHVGTEIYAEQVLGQGVAVPSTREEVALKAWELAGKPAVAVEGEPLSETAQAERWVVESGLMQNESDGTFNGQKKMTKLAALHTLSEAKKLG